MRQRRAGLGPHLSDVGVAVRAPSVERHLKTNLASASQVMIVMVEAASMTAANAERTIVIPSCILRARSPNGWLPMRQHTHAHARVRKLMSPAMVFVQGAVKRGVEIRRNPVSR